MPGLTAKVFRTYNASYTMSNLLQNLDPKKYKNATINEKVKLYNDCNREVAILCNHKRTVGANHAQQMEKMADRVSLPAEFESIDAFANFLVDQGPEVPEMASEDDDLGR